MRAQSLLKTRETEDVANTINRREVAAFIRKLGQEMEDMAEALVEKKPTFVVDMSVLMRLPWITSDRWSRSKGFGDDNKIVFLRSSWLTAGAEPRCN